MPIPPLKYIYTSYGDVYAGDEFPELRRQHHTVLIQRSKIRDYLGLMQAGKTIDRIEEYGWEIHKKLVVGELFDNQIDKHEPPNYNLWFDNRFERKNMFILGAGASANCIVGQQKSIFSTHPLRPPLGNQLFESRFEQFYGKYDGILPAIFDLNQVTVGIEELLENEWQTMFQSGTNSIIPRHISIQLYMRELLKNVSQCFTQQHLGSNLYSKLTYELNKKAEQSNQQFAIVSFNQDTILDFFIKKAFKRHFTTMDDYIQLQESRIIFFKPHGSWNWGWPYVNNWAFTPNDIYERNYNFFDIYFKLLGNHINMVDWSGYGRELMFHDYDIGKLTVDKHQIRVFNDKFDINRYFPAFLIPYREKDELTMPPRHTMCLMNYLSGIENIFIIGWKGNERMFNKLLQSKTSSLKKIVIVDIDPSTVAANLKPLIDKTGASVIIYNLGFEDFVLNGLEKEL